MIKKNKQVAIDPYEFCLCGSGKKYKFCCYGKKDKTFHNSHESMIYGLKNRKKEFLCLHEDVNCSEGIIKSHSIQNNKILSKLAFENHVYTLDMNPDQLMGVDIKKKGKNDATTSNCFCLYHDTNIFKPIELEPYNSSEIQNFIYAYRAFSKACYDRLDELRLHQLLFSNSPNLCINMGMIERMRGTIVGVRENEEIKRYFNSALDEKRYSSIESVIIYLDYEIKFATSYMCSISYDLEGNIINDVWSSVEKMKNIFVNMFPENGKSFIIISWLDKDKEIFSRLKNQLENLKKSENYVKLIKTLNNMVVCQSDNFVFNPEFWDALDSVAKRNFLEKFKASFLGTQSIQNIGLEIERRLTTFPSEYDLFAENIK